MSIVRGRERECGLNEKRETTPNETCVCVYSETHVKGMSVSEHSLARLFIFVLRPSHTKKHTQTKHVSSTSSCILSIERSLDHEFEDPQFIEFGVAKGGNKRSSKSTVH